MNNESWALELNQHINDYESFALPVSQPREIEMHKVKIRIKYLVVTLLSLLLYCLIIFYDRGTY